MNIGIVTTWFERGAAYVSKQYKEVLEAAGHTVYIYARGGETEAVTSSGWGGERVTWAAQSYLPIITYIDEADFKKWLLCNKLDVVFFNEQRWLSPVILCKELNIKTGLYVDYYTEETLRSYGIFDFLICNTRRHHSAFSWHPQAIYIPWGTDVDIFNTASRRIKSDDVRFFTSAGMNPYRKGTDILINAFSLALRERAISDRAVLVVHSQVSLVDFFKALPGQESTLENISYLHRVGKLRLIQKTVSAPGLYHEGDVYVYPSRLDGIGLTVAEAIACGMPVIVPDDAPMNEFLPETGSRKVKIDRFFCRADGYYWPQNEVSIPDLVAAIQEYCVGEGVLEGYRKVSRLHAIENLDWKKNASRIVDVFVGSRILVLSDSARDFAAEISAKNYPLYRKFPRLYRLAYFAKSIVSRLAMLWR